MAGSWRGEVSRRVTQKLWAVGILPKPHSRPQKTEVFRNVLSGRQSATLDSRKRTPPFEAKKQPDVETVQRAVRWGHIAGPVLGGNTSRARQINICKVHGSSPITLRRRTSLGKDPSSTQFPLNRRLGNRAKSVFWRCTDRCDPSHSFFPPRTCPLFSTAQLGVRVTTVLHVHNVRPTRLENSDGVLFPR